LADASKHETGRKPESGRAWGQRLLACYVFIDLYYALGHFFVIPLRPCFHYDYAFLSILERSFLMEQILPQRGMLALQDNFEKLSE